MMFFDDIVLLEENLKKVFNIYNRLDGKRLTFKRKRLRISKTKTEYILYEFVGRAQEVDSTKREITISGDVIGEVEDIFMI